MAQHRQSYHEPYISGHHGHYAPDKEFQGPSQSSQLARLPPMATVIPAAASSPSPVVPDSRDAAFHGRKPSFYSDYATPSPVTQTPPQLPRPSSDTYPLAKRMVDIRQSPTLSSTTVGWPSEEKAQELHPRHMSSSMREPQIQGQIPRPYFTQPSPRSRANSLQQDAVLSPVMIKTASTTPYSASAILNGRPTPPRLPRSPPSTQPSTSPRQEPKSMSISNLLASSSETANTAITTPNIPSSAATTSNPPTAAVQPTPSTYRITVRQQPIAARSCGFGERDRRVIDPPPIVQLTIHDASLTRDEHARRLRHQFSVVHCSIWDAAGQRDMSSMPEDFRQQRRLMGTLVASPFVGLDEHGDEGCFFCFPDLSCRTPGTFRLKFALVVLDPARMCTGERSAIVATAMSEAFQVYNAKDFPGMQASTRLTKRLKEQGCLISIKKGNEKREGGGIGGKGEEDEEEDERGEEEAEGGSASASASANGEGKGRARKRVKR
ncbi:hypothetical protein VTI74DRAFT_1503 [Chaetomium olivicolor]